MKLFLFVRELLCSHALQSHRTPTQGRLVQRLQTPAWGPSSQRLSHLTAGASAVCAALAFLSGGAAGSTQAARENAAPHPELLISYKQWGRKGGPSYGWIQPGSADKLFRLPNKLVMINQPRNRIQRAWALSWHKKKAKSLPIIVTTTTVLEYLLSARHQVPYVPWCVDLQEPSNFITSSLSTTIQDWLKPSA